MRRHSLQLPSFPRLARERLRSTASVSTQELACGSPRERGAGKHPLFPRAWEYLRSDKLRAERETDHNEERSLLCSVCGASCRHSSPSQRGREVRRRSPSVQAALGPVIFNASSMKCFSALAERKKKSSNMKKNSLWKGYLTAKWCIHGYCVFLQPVHFWYQLPDPGLFFSALCLQRPAKALCLRVWRKLRRICEYGDELARYMWLTSCVPFSWCGCHWHHTGIKQLTNHRAVGCSKVDDTLVFEGLWNSNWNHQNYSFKSRDGPIWAPFNAGNLVRNKDFPRHFVIFLIVEATVQQESDTCEQTTWFGSMYMLFPTLQTAKFLHCVCRESIKPPIQHTPSLSPGKSGCSLQ